MPLPSFSYTAPTILWSSPEALARLGSYLKRLSIQKALVVCDERIESGGIAAQVEAASGGRVAAIWSKVLPDAPKASVEEGAAEAARVGADGIVAVGGGSSIDTGKAIALLAKHGGDLARWDGANKVGTPGLPLVAIPTTAGTGSEATNIAVVKDESASRKLVLIDRAIYPSVAILDPRLTVGLPARLTAATGIDALTHAIEGLVSKYSQPICDAIGLECVRIVRTWLPRAIEQPDDLEARGWMLLAASMAGQLVSMTFSGVAHSVSHALGIGWGVHHGTANGIALPWSIRFNAEAASAADAYSRCARLFDLPKSDVDVLRLADAVERMVADLGLPTRLTEVGLTESDLPRLAQIAFADPSHGPNPVAVESVERLEEALRGLL